MSLFLGRLGQEKDISNIMVSVFIDHAYIVYFS